MDKNSNEESYAKCGVCAMGLSAPEHSFYGNRCVYHRKTYEKINMFQYLILCYYDWQIHQIKKRLIEGVMLPFDDYRSRILACLGVLGYRDITEIQRIVGKKALLRELKNFGRD